MTGRGRCRRRTMGIYRLTRMAQRLIGSPDARSRRNLAKRLLPAFMGGILMFAGCDTAPQRLVDLRGTCERCNIILISLDTMRADHLGAYGYARDTSPNLDAIARQGILYESSYAQAPGTLLSHMSILTGLYPRRHGVVDKRLSLRESTPTLPGELRNRGYATAAFTGGGYVRERFGYHGFDHFQHSRYWDSSYRSEDRQFEEMLDWIDAQTEPFFLFWHSYRVHSPYNPPPETDRFSDPEYDGLVDVNPGTPTEVCRGVAGRGCERRGLPYFERILDAMQPHDVQHVVDKYDGEVLSLDALVGRLWEQLDHRGLLADTLVVVTSDHGESFAERERNRMIGHGPLYREVLHVPLLLYVPGIEPGMTSSEIVETIDIMPTVLDLVGVARPQNLDGRSLADGEIAHDQRFAFAEAWDDAGLIAVSVIHGDRHLIDWTDGRDELFDLVADPGEQSNLIEREPALARRLRRIAERLGELGATPGIQDGVLDEETLRDLDALGYL